jgi:hypothetical protein
MPRHTAALAISADMLVQIVTSSDFTIAITDDTNTVPYARGQIQILHHVQPFFLHALRNFGPKYTARFRMPGGTFQSHEADAPAARLSAGIVHEGFLADPSPRAIIHNLGYLISII